jgi:3-phosphoshikimate 1-carboxyvinyltransferase
MTLDVLKKSGIEIFEDDPGVFYIPGNQEYRLTGEHEAGGDWSSAAMWLSSGACSEEGSSLTVEGISSDSIHGDKAITDILKGMGADILWEGNSVTVKAHRLHSRLIDARDIPDLVPAIAVAACKAEGKTVIMNAERLRLKESDRIRSIADVLKRLGAMVNERPDGLEIFGGYRLKGGTVPSFNDHRIVMMAACLRNQTDGNLIIEDAEAVNKSYPGFFDDYRMLGGKTEEL